MHIGSYFLAFTVLFFSAYGGFAASLSAPTGRGTVAVPPEKRVDSNVSEQSVGPDVTELQPDSGAASASPAEPSGRAVQPSRSAELTGPAALARQRVQLSSPAVAQRFYQIAYELTNSEKVTTREAEQAIVFLSAALNLDSNASSYAMPLLIKLICRYGQADHSETVSRLLAAYMGQSADREVVNEAVRYLLDKLDSREQRENFLEELLGKFGNKNVVIGSEWATQIGLLMNEKTDSEGAQFYLIQAYNNNEYSKVAFARLAELAPNKFTPAIYLGHLRFILRENPSDIRAAVAFAQYAERLELYDVAARAYEYCANLFAYLYPSEVLPSDIYLPWVISCYNTPLSRQKCLQIADTVRKAGRFDLLLEAVAGKAAGKIGDTAQADLIFQNAEDKAQQLLMGGSQRTKEPSPTTGSKQKVGVKEFAWFYCFALPDPPKALDWANKAYSTEPNSPVTAAILAYALLMNGQTEWAKPLTSNYQRNQTADLALAIIQLKEGQKDLAIKTLNSLIVKDPGSLAAEQAKEILAQQGAQYVPPFDPVVIMGALEKGFGQTLVPAYVPPDKRISVQFNARGNKFSYGSNFDATVAIVNNSSEPLVISDDSLFRGNIRIDADVTGDLKKNIPNLVSTKIRTTFLVEPGRSLLIPVQLVTGELNRLLFAHPQASLDIVFNLYIDPVVTGDGKVANRLVNIAPAKLSVKRPAVDITGKYLRTRFNSISTGQPGQKIKTAQLFVGLLMEQQIMSGRKPLYKFLYADWMPAMLKSALTHESGLLRNRADSEWEVKVNTMADMLYLSLDQDLASAVAENINSPSWPVRIQAIYLLGKNPENKFRRVLDWSAKYDSNALVRNMAVALGGVAVRQPEQPTLSSGGPAAEESPTEPLK
jgi:tetratricopeptide (TPR) repeat protein